MRLLAILFLCCSSMTALAQDDLLSMLEEELPDQLATATFKGTRLINGHSIETRREGTLDFIISHRFGTLNSGAYNLWGLDNANIRFGLEYAVTDRFTLALGRSSFQKVYDGYLKFRLLQQRKGQRNVPVSVTVLGTTSVKTLKRFDGFEPSFADKLANTGQVLIARKMNDKLSLQLMPTYVHYNLIEANESANDVLAVGFGGRMKVSKQVTINAEYYYQVSDKGSQYNDAIALGVDIETGGHVFQLQFTNATAMIERGFVGETTNDFFGGDIHFGFNISRAFQLK
jgi:hypothetical protein